jgi:hypothetical protein
VSEHISVDRAKIKAMIEDHWRSYLGITGQYLQSAHELSDRFAEDLDATTSLMPPEQGQEFNEVFNEELNNFMDEYRRNPAAVEQHLGLREHSTRPSCHQASLADVAVRKAFRATVWDSVDSLLRLFR